MQKNIRSTISKLYIILAVLFKFRINRNSLIALIITAFFIYNSLLTIPLTVYSQNNPDDEKKTETEKKTDDDDNPSNDAENKKR